MSKWRQKGFVQDSDEDEEESQLTSQGSKRNAALKGRVERVEEIDRTPEELLQAGNDVLGPIGTWDSEIHGVREALEAASKEGPKSPIPRRTSPRRPTASPLTPAATLQPIREPTESPDPLQSSPSPKSRKYRQVVSSQLLGSPSLSNLSPPPGAQRRAETTISPRSTREPPSQLAVPPSNNVKPNVPSNILGAFGVDPLSDASDDDSLSDPPTDLESPETDYVVAQPHRRTAVQVIIPSSTALQRHIFEEESRRELRQRKPIQLHPYALEGELYRREVQSRGLKPVARPRSPEQRSALQNAETQEKDFDPNETPDSSPPEVEIPVSTPVIRKAQMVARLRASDLARHRLPTTQLHLPHAAKRRKLNIALTQAAAGSTSIFDDEIARRDIWSFPPNSPPYSSSPLLTGRESAQRLGRAKGTTPAPNLPTPSTSSVFQDEVLQLPGSDVDQIDRSFRPQSSELRRPTRIVLSDLSSSDSDSSSSEAAQSDQELRQVGKKIRGVLPASWLRFDQQAQDRRKAQARERERVRQLATQSPDPELQRGVAQRIVKRTAAGGRYSATTTPAKDGVLISDGSDDEHGEQVHNHTGDVQNVVKDANALAAAFDCRYADDDSDNMENDRLHLFTMGGTGAERKKKMKATNAFGKAKRLKATDGTAKRPNIGQTGKKRHAARSRGARRTPPPALSVVDLNISLSNQGSSAPQFLRLARRQALRRPDLARQSPRMKQIRLHSSRDTEEANVTLQQWQSGVLKPKTTVTPQRTGTLRPPLEDRSDNQQYAQQQMQVEPPRKDVDQVSDKRRSKPLGQKRTVISSALGIFQRTAMPVAKSSQRPRKVPRVANVLERSALRNPLPFKAAQLEGDEQVLGHDHRKTAFEKGLRRANHQIPGPGVTSHVYMNLQLARFLADDDAVLPPLPSARDIGEEQVEDVSKQAPPSRKRLMRKKMQVHRVDVEAREFRQPSEQAVQDVLGKKTENPVEEDPAEDGLASLQGLGPHGTRYPTTFDVTPLQADTYFHASTLIGSEELHRALDTGRPDGRDLNEFAGYYTITHESATVRCGLWNDETSSALQEMAKHITAPLDIDLTRLEQGHEPIQKVMQDLARFLRSLINYVSSCLSFSDPVDRKVFVAKIHQLLFSLFDQVSVIHHTSYNAGSGSDARPGTIRVMAYLLVSGVQACLIAQNSVVDRHVLAEVQGLVHNAAKTIISHIVHTGVSELGAFLERNKRQAVRQHGIQEDDTDVECVVVCMHALEKVSSYGMGFWDFVSQDLSSTTAGATHIKTFETAWATLFTLVPFIEVDITGIPVRNRRECFSSDNWSCISIILRRVLELYQSTYRKHASSLNDYVRANLARCHRLIKYWHWQRPEQMLNAVFDFFGRNGLKPLRRETANGSIALFDHATAEQPLSLEPNECSFHIALKCLALGLRGMRKSYTEKKIRSFVFRTIPNHGRSYPKDQPLDEENLAALRNHHDLLCTLYWAAPSPCRPKLELLRGLVSHENSHREACRVNVRAWANLTTFQLSSDEQYVAVKPFALWHKDIMHQTLKQYRLAKSEADDYLKSGVLDGTTDVSAVMVRQTMERNQEQVIATLRDCIAGMHKAVQSAADKTALSVFLIDSDIVALLELPHLEDRRLVNVTRDTLALLREYTKLQKVTAVQKESQTASEESQDYGDFPDMDDVDDLEPQSIEVTQQQTGLAFMQSPLWHLLSNAFGAEMSPDDNLLMDCVDTWIVFAEARVSSRARTWSFYLESFSQVSWHQLRQTEQTRKFGPYFLACLADKDRTAYEHHRQEFITALLLSLVDRESMLRFQYRLLHAIVKADKANPLMKSLPFLRDQSNGSWDITSDTLRSRRLALISSILSNMRDDLHSTSSEYPARASEVRRTYATMLKDLMTRMKANYVQLQQGTTVTGAYAEFVQKIVQFLKQYTGDICPVIPFFTDSVAFPLPSTDPTYVVGRLCGYAPKALEPGTAKQLSVFIQTVAQQAAADNQQSYLVNQLTTALCSDETPATDRTALRSILLQSILPTYLENAFASSTTFIIASPILRSLPSILDRMMFDLRITQPASVSSIMKSILAIGHAFIHGTENLTTTPALFDQPHILAVSTHMLEAMASSIPVLEYICSQTTTNMHPLVTYMRDLSAYFTDKLHDVELQTIPNYDGDAHTISSGDQHSNISVFCRRGLEDSMKVNWSESNGAIWFGQGHARREVVFDIGSVEEERERLMAAVKAFQRVLHNVYGEEDGEDHGSGPSIAYDVIV
jgi:hypothetical protein